MEVFLAQLVAGLSIGGIYVLVVVGTDLLLLVRNIMNYAFAFVLVMGMYIGWMVLEWDGGNLALGLVAMFVGALALMMVTEPIFRPLAKRKASMEAVVVGVGIGMILTDIMSHFIHNGRPIVFPLALTTSGPSISSGAFFVSTPQILAIVVGVLAVVALGAFLYWNKQGRAFRAMAQDVDTARVLGIPLVRAGVYSFAIAGVMAGTGAILTAATLGTASAALGDMLALKATVLVLVAGGGNMKGGLILALAMGVAESMTQAYLPGRWSDAIVFGILMVAIILRPDGIFGSKS
jgi:branched-chain amino acid transport system permease protein